MKKTLTVNLGGTVFHIDEDAYRLLDNYLSNLRVYFLRQEGAEEIVNDIETRISELFLEKITAGSQVITIADVEEMIARMGKPEDFGEGDERENRKSSSGTTGTSATFRRRFYRNPDDKILGGVISGFAAYMGWSTTVLRLIMLIVLICGVGFLIPIYIICWVILPEAHTATEKLNMRGEDVTIENIGKTVTDGFERVANNVNDYMKRVEPRTFLEKLGDVLVSVVGFFLKACLILLALVFSPVLFVLALIFVVLIIMAIVVVAGGGTALLHALPLVWSPFMEISPILAILSSIAGVALVGIPLLSIVHVMLCSLFHWSPMSSGLKWTLFTLWIVALVGFIICLSGLNWPYPFLLIG